MSNDISVKFEKDLLELIRKYGWEKTTRIKKLIIKGYSGKKLPKVQIKYHNFFKRCKTRIFKSDKYKFEKDLCKILEKCKYRTDNIQTLEIRCEVEKRPIIKLSYYQF